MQTGGRGKERLQARHECNGFHPVSPSPAVVGVSEWWRRAQRFSPTSSLYGRRGSWDLAWLHCAYTAPPFLSPEFQHFLPSLDLHICTEAVLHVRTLNFAHGLASANPAPAERKHTVLSTPAKPFLLMPSDLFKIQGSTLTSLDKIQACVYILVPSPAYFSGLPMRVKGNHRIQALQRPLTWQSR